MRSVAADVESIAKERAFHRSIPTQWWYQIAEMTAYCLPSMLVGSSVTLFGAPWPITFGAIVTALLWPLIKFRIARTIARWRKIRDPRRILRSSSFFYDGFLFWGSPPLRQIRLHGSLSRSLDIIYNYFGDFRIMPLEVDQHWWMSVSPVPWVNTLIKQWTDFWCDMPIAHDVRARLRIVTETIVNRVSTLQRVDPTIGLARPVRILLLAGGTKQDVIMAVQQLRDRYGMIFEVVCVEPDGKFAITRSKQLLEAYCVPAEFFRDVPKMVSWNDPKRSLEVVVTKAGFCFEEFDIVVCIGLGDYAYGDAICRFLKMIDNGKTIITANISENHVERPFLHHLIQWPKMQYLSREEYQSTLRSVYGPSRKIDMVATPHEIFNIAVIHPHT